MQENTAILNSIPVDPLTGAISTPIYQTSTFVQQAPGVHNGFDYARSNNPTRAVLEQLIAQLEKGSNGYAFASGLAAIDAVVKLLSYGDEIIAVDDIYGGAFRLLTHVYRKFGISVKYVDTTHAENITAAITPKPNCSGSKHPPTQHSKFLISQPSPKSPKHMTCCFVSITPSPHQPPNSPFPVAPISLCTLPPNT